MGKGCAGDISIGSSYGNVAGFIFIFNLVVGTGALTLPKAIVDAGWILSLIFLCVVALMAFISATFVIEAQAASNAKLRDTDGRNGPGRPFGSGSIQKIPGSLDAPLLGASSQHSPYSIVSRIEMTYMGELLGELLAGTPERAALMGSRVRNFFSLAIVIYLYGDLAVYCVAIPTALSTIAKLPFLVHEHEHGSSSTSGGGGDDSDNWNYAIYLFCFIGLTLPICFFDFQKSAWLQYATCAVRNSCFFIMVSIMAAHLVTDRAGIPPDAHLAASRTPLRTFSFPDFPELYGVCIYAFMCHHSLPSIISPLKNKNAVFKLFTLDYIAILAAYVGLGMTAAFTFGGLPDAGEDYCPPTHISDEPRPCPVQHLITQNFESFEFAPVAYYLSLYPVLALTTNFPLISITLRNNLMTIIPNICPSAAGIKRWQCTLLAVIPPYITAFFYRDVNQLAGFTGGYAGVFIQLIIPAVLALLARRWEAANVRSQGANPLRSPFSSNAWPSLILVWAAICLVANTVFHVIGVASATDEHKNSTVPSVLWSAGMH